MQVGGFKVGHLGQNLLGGEAGGEELEYVGHADAHSADAGPAAALARVGGDVGEQGFHAVKIFVSHPAAAVPGAAGVVLGAGGPGRYCATVSQGGRVDGLARASNLDP